MSNSACITLNGEAVSLMAPTTVAQLIEQQNLGTRRIAVEINEDIIPRSLHVSTELADGDVVEIIQAIGGG